MRAAKLMEIAKAKGYEALIFHTPVNIRYLSGYTGEGCLLVTQDEAIIVTDFRYYEQVSRQAPECRLAKTVTGKGESKVLYEELSNKGIKSVAVETSTLTVDQYEGLKNALTGIELIKMPHFAEEMRVVKDEEEINSIIKAAEIATNAFNSLLNFIKPGQTEKEIQVELDYRMRKFGGEGNSFSTIACAGPNGSLPHAIPSDRPIQNGELLTLDFGCLYNGYCSDTTRTVAIGKISDELKNLYNAVLTAQLMALDAVKPGVKCNLVDKVARDYLDNLYPGAFGHGLGHGVGLLIHEQPRFSPLCEDILVPGHVVTVEPGVYIPGLGGCRIEDMVIVTDNGYINPVTAPKQLVEL